MSVIVKMSVRGRVLVGVVLGALLTVLIAPSAMATPGAVGTVTPASPVGAGTTRSYTFTLDTSDGSIQSFNLDAPSGWSISVNPEDLESTQTGVTAASSTEIQGRDITVDVETTLTVTFKAAAPCGTSDPTDWALDANAAPGFDGDPVPTDQDGSSLSTPLQEETNCTAAFSAQPADAAFLNGSPQNISSVKYQPSADPIEVIVKDADALPRPGISVSLNFAVGGNPTGATLSTSPTSVISSDPDGLSDFPQVTIDKTGLKYKLIPNGGLGVVGTASGPFDVYQEQTNCSGACAAHANSTTIHSTVNANSNGGSLAALVSGVSGDLISCDGTFPSSYVYKPVSAEVTSWQFTGSGTQIITVRVDKSLIKKVFPNRGSAHIDFCYQPDGAKTFVDKFGVTKDSSHPGLLSDCTKKIKINCIVSETALAVGDRIIKVTVEDGKGRP